MKVQGEGMKKIILIVWLLTCMSIQVSAQNSRIVGTITDASTGSTLPGANVFIKDSNLGSASDRDGEYIIRNVSPGIYTLLVTYVGYESVEVQVEVGSGEIVERDVAMTFKVLLGEEVVVTAQAEGQMQAINQQISSLTVKNIVSSSKIQELPESNAAEAVGRLPGISLQREGGEGNKVVIRGLSPQYNKIQVDGVSLAATGEDDRSVDLSMISPEVLAGIEVSKTAMADQEADVLGGTVNFVLRGAPREPTLSFNMQGGYNDLRGELKNYKYNIGAGKRFFDNKLGIFALGNLERVDRSDNSVFANYQMLQDSITIANGVGFQDIDRIKKRLGGVMVLDYTIPNTHLKFSNMFSRIDENTYNRQEYLSAADRNHRYVGIYGEEDINVSMNSLQLEQYIGRAKVTSSMNYSQSSSKIPQQIIIEANEGLAFDRDWSYTEEFLHPADFTKKAVNDTSRIYIEWFRERNAKVSESEFSTDLNLEWGYETRIAQINFKIGGMYKHKIKEYDNEEARIPLAWNDLALVRTFLADEFGLTGYDIDDDFPYFPFIDRGYDPGRFMAGNFSINRIPDRDLLIKYFNAIKNLETVRGSPVGKTVYRDYTASIMNDYDGYEDYVAGYILPIIQFSDILTIIPGVRYEHNKTNYSANRAFSAARWADPIIYENFSSIRKNEYFLPMFHVKYQPMNWFDIRASYTETLSRPGYQRIIPTWSVWESNIAYNNTSLVPSTSKNTDLFFSFYNNQIGLLTIGGFHKNIRDFIFETTIWIIDESYLNPEWPESVRPGGRAYGFINNPNIATLYGFELEWQSNFWFLPGALRGLVLSTNYTYTYSSLVYPRVEAVWGYVQIGPIRVPRIVDTKDGSYEARLLDQPTHIFNLTLGFDYKGFGIRSSVQFRSDVFAGIHWYPEMRSNTEPLTLYDMKIRQKLPLKGLQLFFDVNNISRAIEQTTNNGTGWFSYNSYYGLTVVGGFRYDF
jgi:TonB-dependent receptor